MPQTYPGGSLSRFRQPQTEQTFCELLRIEGEQRIDIALVRERLVADDRPHKENNGGDITVQPKRGSQDQVDDAHELQRISQLVVLLRVVGERDERHI